MKTITTYLRHAWDSLVLKLVVATLAVALTVAVSACSAATPETPAASVPGTQLTVTVQREGDGIYLGSYEHEVGIGAATLYIAIGYLVDGDDIEALANLKQLDGALRTNRALLYPVVYRPLLETLFEARDTVREDPAGVYRRLLPQVQQKIWAIIKETT